MTRASGPTGLAVIAAAFAACAPSLATMQPAHVAPKGHFQATAGLEVGIPTGAIVRAIDAGKTLSDAAAQGSLTADQERQVFEAGVNVLASPPSAGPHLALAYTPVERFEIGVRYAGDGWRVGTRYQTPGQSGAPFDLPVGAGLSPSAYAFRVGDIFPTRKVDVFPRGPVDV